MKPIPSITPQIVAAYVLVCEVIDTIYKTLQSCNVPSTRIDEWFNKVTREEIASDMRYMRNAGYTQAANAIDAIMQLRGMKPVEEEESVSDLVEKLVEKAKNFEKEYEKDCNCMACTINRFIEQHKVGEIQFIKK